ncbi:MAG TPA: hypothetical protein VFN51_02025 [Candidatus Saccharimonadales bacterium]|nr:hypothetical protein [Candidatus Saccharimonadales bacterium]
MDNQPVQPNLTPLSQPSFQSLQTNRKDTFRKVLAGILAIILIACVGYCIYAWQHSKVTQLNAQVTTLTTQSSTQANKIINLNKQLSTASQALSQSRKPIAATKSSTGPFNQTVAITQAVKAYKDNVQGASQASVTINGVTASGNAAYGSITLPGGGGGAWLAINNSGSWTVVSQGQVGVCKSQVQQYNLPAIWAPTSFC